MIWDEFVTRARVGASLPLLRDLGVSLMSRMTRDEFITTYDFGSCAILVVDGSLWKAILAVDNYLGEGKSRT